MPDMVNRQELMRVVQRVENMDEEDEGRKADRKAVMDQAKERGLNPVMIKRIVNYRKNKDKIDAAEAEFEAYKLAIED